MVVRCGRDRGAAKLTALVTVVRVTARLAGTRMPAQEMPWGVVMGTRAPAALVPMALATVIAAAEPMGRLKTVVWLAVGRDSSQCPVPALRR